jgi:serine/threonine protein kinase
MPPVSTGKLLADRYRVVGRLGAGGMAVVVLAEDERLGRRVAVKRLHAESPEDAARRFEREAKLGASLNHPNIVAVYDIVSDDEGVLIVMEYVEGHTLRHEMDRGPLSPARAIELLSDVAAGLDHAHEHGVVHRDVKPANVLITAGGGGGGPGAAGGGGRAKITDLGIATAAERTNITRSGVVLGTAAYMAPERLDGDAGGPAVDVYALAAVAFEALSGRKAVTGKTAMEVAQRVMSEPPPDLAAVVPGTPARAAEALRRGLAKDPAARPASAGELVRELAGAYAEEAAAAPAAAAPKAPAASGPPVASAPPEPPEPEPPRPRPRWLGPAALVAAMALVAVVAVLLATGGGGGSTQKQAARKPSSGQKRSNRGGGSATPAAPSTGGGATAPDQAPGASTAPAAALQGLYTRAAEDDFAGAWKLGTDRLHAQFGSLTKFTATFSTLDSIEFPKLSVASQQGTRATVAYSTVARHTDRTDRCTARATLVRQGGTWLVDHLDNVDCKSS